MSPGSAARPRSARVAATLVALVALAALAGCLGPATPGADGASGADAPTSASSPAVGSRAGQARGDAARADGAPPADAPGAPGGPPAWVLGEYWTLAFDLPGSGSRSESVVVVEAGPAGYVTASTSPETAARDAMTDVSFVGPTGTDLSGSQDGEPVEFFRWPLTDGATWTTTWDGVEVTLTAAADPAVPTPGGAEAGFRIDGIAEGRDFVSYTYAPSLRWWSAISFPGQGFGARVIDHGTGFNGTYFVGRLLDLATVEADAGPAMPPLTSFTLEQSAARLEVRLVAESPTPGSLVLDVQGPAGDGDTVTSTCLDPAGACLTELYLPLEPTPGEGQVGLASHLLGPHRLTVRAAVAEERRMGGTG